MNKVRKMMLRAGLAALAVSITTSAQAARYLITFRGVVENSVNQTSEFGLTGRNSLDGQAFTTEFTLTDPGGSVTLLPNTVLVDGFDASFGPGFVPVKAKLNINGILLDNSSPIVVAGNYQSSGGLAQVDNAPSGDSLFLFTDNSSFYSSGSTIQWIRSNVINPDGNLFADLNYTTPRSYTLSGSDISRGNFIYQVYDSIAQRSLHLATGTLVAQSFSVQRLGGSPGGVPEPASWALMIAGFGIVGSAMRRQTVARVTYA